MKRKLTVPLSIVLLFTLVLMWAFWDDILNIKYAPQIVYTEPAFFADYQYDRTLMVRTELPNSKNILMKNSSGKGVYRYEAATQKISFIDDKNWDDAQGEIKTCGTEIKSSIKSVPQAYGRKTLNSKSDSTSTKTAIITSNGFSIPPLGILPNLGASGRITGVRYFEIIFNNGEKVGKTLRTQKLEMDSSPYLCWSANNEFVIISNSSYSTLAVVDIANVEN